jgi:putative SOS response-associated peptidase YedK
VTTQQTRYKLQSMKWGMLDSPPVTFYITNNLGLIPFWTKRNPDYGSLLRTINCRDDSLIENRGMWTTMKQKKRCIVIAQGFYEWLKKNNGKERIPHYIKRKDGKLMCMAGLWDCAQYDGSDEKLYTYTIITTSSNKQLNFLHDRMPVIFDNDSEDLRTWVDPKRYEWSQELQSLLKPFQGELEIYPVSKDVGKVGNNSPNFIIPIDSTENKNNIANFFNHPKGTKSSPKKADPVKKEEVAPSNQIKQEVDDNRETIDHSGTEDNAPLPVPKASGQGVKREHAEDEVSGPPAKAARLVEKSPVKAISSTKPSGRSRSSTSNGTSPVKPVSKEKGSQKITSFFSK